MLHHSDGSEAAHHSHADQLQSDVEPLHGGCAEEAAALVEFQAPGVFFLEPAEGKRTESSKKINIKKIKGHKNI